MTTIHDAYINALLADATYALEGNITDGLTKDGLVDALEKRMTPTLAKYISDNFTILNHVDTGDSGFFNSGFDATVWRNNKSRKVYVSLTGSEWGPDTQPDNDFTKADVDLTISGLANHQVADMITWWLVQASPAGTPVPQFALFPTSPFPYRS